MLPSSAMKLVLLRRFIVCTALVTLFIVIWLNAPKYTSSIRKGKSTVVYVYSGNDALYGDNLAYFIRNGVNSDDGNDYYIVLQQGLDWGNYDRTCSCTINCPKRESQCQCKCPSEMETSIPSNIRLVFHENRCFDMGTFGELLDKKLIDLTESEYVVIMNSSIRGPFLPTYVSKDFRWISALTSKINSVVKLVGPSISCGSRQPHVQSFLIATDMVGLEVLRQEGALKCYRTQADAVKYAELGASEAMFKHGYSIDSLMLKYDGVDWRLKQNHKCNQRLNPGPQFMYDGTTVNPLETLFVKVKSLHAQARWANVIQAIKYSDWALSKGQRAPSDIKKNDFHALRKQMLPKIRATVRKECFDFDTYKAANYDIKVLGWSNDQLFDHYITDGYFEARPGVKFTC